MPCVVPTCATTEGSFTLFPCHKSLSERWLKAIQVGSDILVGLTDDGDVSQTEICLWHFGPDGKPDDDDEDWYQEPRMFINGIGDQVEIDSCRLCLQFYPSYCMVSTNGNLGGNDIKSNVYEALRVGFKENDFLNLVCIECLARLELLNSIRKDFAQAEVEFQELLKIAQDSTNNIRSTIKLEHPSVNFEERAESTPDPDCDIIEGVISDESTTPRTPVFKIGKKKVKRVTKRISRVSLKQKQPLKVHENKLHGTDHEVKIPAEKSKSIVCETCDKSFMFKRKLNAHVRMAHAINDLPTCNICNTSFTVKSSLKRHMLVHTNEKPYNCTKCDASFRYAHGLNRHMNKAHDSKNSHVCGECNNKCKNYHALYRHKQIVHLENRSIGAQLRRHLVCKLCDVPHAKTNDLKQHIQASHANETYPYRQCSHCPQMFLSEEHLAEHKDIHTDKYACKECGKRNTSVHKLQSHMDTHTDVKQFDCPICSTKSYKSLSALRLHMASHTNVKRHLCEFCEKAFMRKDQLMIHRRIHTGEKPYQCTNCLKRFSDSGSYRYHKKRCQVPIPKVEEENVDDL